MKIRELTQIQIQSDYGHLENRLLGLSTNDQHLQNLTEHISLGCQVSFDFKFLQIGSRMAFCRYRQSFSMFGDELAVISGFCGICYRPPEGAPLLGRPAGGLQFNLRIAVT